LRVHLLHVHLSGLFLDPLPSVFDLLRSMGPPPASNNFCMGRDSIYHNRATRSCTLHPPSNLVSEFFDLQAWSRPESPPASNIFRMDRDSIYHNRASRSCTLHPLLSLVSQQLFDVRAWCLESPPACNNFYMGRDSFFHNKASRTGALHPLLTLFSYLLGLSIREG
ncbi:hypothetical protein, partial [Escherichia coli]|uniref:hypothetical protein n=1 Tax=Escherichia coli TaxID=562 RepID=UPI001BC9BFEA